MKVWSSAIYLTKYGAIKFAEKSGYIIEMRSEKLYPITVSYTDISKILVHTILTHNAMAFSYHNSVSFETLKDIEVSGILCRIPCFENEYGRKGDCWILVLLQCTLSIQSDTD